MPFQPNGAWTALVSPFSNVRGVDEARFRRLVEFQIDQGITGLVPCGTTGESPVLAWEEHLRLVEVAIEVADGRVGVLAGAGSNNTTEAIDAVDTAWKSGASATLVVDCYYNGPSSAELRGEYYERILDAVPDAPVVPYIIPGRTGCALNAADLAHLHLTDPARVPAVKQATGDLERMRRDRELAGERLAILSGDDDMTLPMMTDPMIGAAGVISVMSNLVPKAMTELVAAERHADHERGSDIAAKIGPLLKLVGCRIHDTQTLPDGRTVDVEHKYRNPLPLKTMMAGLGMIDGLARPPLGRMSAPAVRECRQALRGLWGRAPDILRPIEQAFDVDIEHRLGDDSVWAALTG